MLREVKEQVLFDSFKLILGWKPGCPGLTKTKKI
jgi:hypothetical protein